MAIELGRVVEDALIDGLEDRYHGSEAADKSCQLNKDRVGFLKENGVSSVGTRTATAMRPQAAAAHLKKYGRTQMLPIHQRKMN